jgi:5-methylcytosine-specific restriction protein A
MYKPPNTEESGGGQSYIDFPVKSIKRDTWRLFFEDVNGGSESTATHGPEWTFPMFSVGCNNQLPVQEVKIYQRRKASISIAAQKLGSKKNNRVLSWHPSNKFPRPVDPKARKECPKGLVVYLVKTQQQQIWAGWFINENPLFLMTRDDAAEALFAPVIENLKPSNSCGSQFFDEDTLFMHTNSISEPFFTHPKGHYVIPDYSLRDEATEIEIDFELDSISIPDPVLVEKVSKVRLRNGRLVKKLKDLYDNRCQITGENQIFLKRDGVRYTEAHHLIPLGLGGFDSPQNLVIISPYMHRMLHYANVDEINFSKLQHNEDGSASLVIVINNIEYVINYNSQHAGLFMSKS